MTDISRCNSCRWWVTDDSVYSYAGQGDNFRQCQSPLMMQGYHIDTATLPLNAAHVEDDEGWGIFTGRDFGCVNHEVASD